MLIAMTVYPDIPVICVMTHIPARVVERRRIELPVFILRM
jgi:hypothetical protein